jgi:uncharacterized protein YxjI
MRYTLASMFSKDQFTIDDDGGSPLFEVRRIHGLDGNSLSLRDLAGNELAWIKPRTGPTRFEVTVGSQQPITVRDKGRFGRKYCIDTPAGEMSATVGDFSPGPYELLSSETVRANVSRGKRLKKDLVIDLADGRDTISLIAIVLAIETLRDDRYRLSRAFLTSVRFSGSRPWLPDMTEVDHSGVSGGLGTRGRCDAVADEPTADRGRHVAGVGCHHQLLGRSA